MSEELHAKLLAFLANAMVHEGIESLIKIELTYAPIGGFRADPLRTWRRESEPDLFTGRNLVYTQRLVTEIFDLAENHADSFGQGKHRFMVRAQQAGGDRLTHAFVLLPSFNADDQAIATQGGTAPELVPSPSGQILQLQRHLENMQRLTLEKDRAYLSAIGHHAGQMRDENIELRRQIAEMSKERMEWLNTIEAARSENHRREVEGVVVGSREERKNLAAKKIINLLPVALSHWMGSGKTKTKPGDAAGGNAGKPVSPLAQLVGKLLESLTEDQRGQIGAALSMEQQIAFVEIVDVVDNGDSVLLPTMLHDLISTLSATQIAALMTPLSAAQRSMFASAMKLATAQANPNPDAKPSDEAAPVNGTAAPAAPEETAS